MLEWAQLVIGATTHVARFALHLLPEQDGGDRKTVVDVALIVTKLGVAAVLPFTVRPSDS